MTPRHAVFLSSFSAAELKDSIYTRDALTGQGSDLTQSR